MKRMGIVIEGVVLVVGCIFLLNQKDTREILITEEQELANTSLVFMLQDEEGNYISTNYITAYTNGTSTGSGVKVYEVGKTGDATKEVDRRGPDAYNWFNDIGRFLKSSEPFFERGGEYLNKASAGVFCSGGEDGTRYVGMSFRIVLPGETH